MFSESCPWLSQGSHYFRFNFSHCFVILVHMQFVWIWCTREIGFVVMFTLSSQCCTFLNDFQKLFKYSCFVLKSALYQYPELIYSVVNQRQKYCPGITKWMTVTVFQYHIAPQYKLIQYSSLLTFFKFILMPIYWYVQELVGFLYIVSVYTVNNLQDCDRVLVKYQ